MRIRYPPTLKVSCCDASLNKISNSKMHSSYLLFCCTLFFASVSKLVFGAGAPVNSIPVKVVNHAGAPIEVFWIDTNSLEENLVRQTSKPLRNSSDANINSYNGHQFVAKFLDDIPGAEAFFTKGPNEETVLITYDPESNIMNAKQITKFDEIMDLINDASVTCNDLKDNAFANCIGTKVIEEVQRLIETTKEIKRYRDLMSPRLYEYICADAKPNVTEGLRSLSFEDRKERYTAELMIDTERAKMWVVPNAISVRECELLQKHSVAIEPAAQPSSPAAASAAAVVAGSDGSSQVTAAVDMAKQDGLFPHRSYQIAEENPFQDPLWALFSKVYKLTNFVSKHKLPVLPAGQEGFGISYLRVGEGVRPSCAGTCDQTPFKEGDRVASALLFCQVAEGGGTLIFPKADVVLKPSVGMGVFFTYRHANSSQTDDGYSEHSLCPVRAGQHTVVSLHLRDGVARVTAPALDGSGDKVSV